MKTIIETNEAPAPIGPYSQAVAWANLIFSSGQIGINPLSGSFEHADIQSETRQVLENLSAVLKAGGADLSSVVKCSIFLTDLGQFEAVNAVYREFFGESQAPARETVQVSALPKQARVEISAIAYRSDQSAEHGR